MANSRKMLTAAFRRRSDAAAAHDWLMARGYSSSDINVLMSDSTRSALREEHAPISAGSHAAEGVATGGAIGTAVGATLAALAAVGTSLVVPGLGIVVAGPIVAALAGGGAGAVTGGLVGGLVGLGIPQSNAQSYETILKEGGVIFGVTPHTDEDSSSIEEYFREKGAENIVYT